MINELTNNHLFGILITVAFFFLGIWLKQRFKNSFINPLLMSVVLIIALLLLLDIPFENYMKGGGVIHSFLGPVTVVLALPLYRQRKLLNKYKYPIIGGILAGVFTSLISVIVLCRFLNLNSMLERSFISHSVTTPIGIELSNTLGAVEGITVVSIVITGIFGVLIAPVVYKLFRITHPIAKGLGMGTSAHALGTSKAMEMGETEGAVSSLAIGLAALTTVVLIAFLQLAGWY